MLYRLVALEQYAVPYSLGVQWARPFRLVEGLYDDLIMHFSELIPVVKQCITVLICVLDVLK